MQTLGPRPGPPDLGRSFLFERDSHLRADEIERMEKAGEAELLESLRRKGAVSAKTDSPNPFLHRHQLLRTMESDSRGPLADFLLPWPGVSPKKGKIWPSCVLSSRSVETNRRLFPRFAGPEERAPGSRFHGSRKVPTQGASISSPLGTGFRPAFPRALVRS